MIGDGHEPVLGQVQGLELLELPQEDRERGELIVGQVQLHQPVQQTHLVGEHVQASVAELEGAVIRGLLHTADDPHRVKRRIVPNPSERF